MTMTREEGPSKREASVLEDVVILDQCSQTGSSERIETSCYNSPISNPSWIEQEPEGPLSSSSEPISSNSIIRSDDTSNHTPDSKTLPEDPLYTNRPLSSILSLFTHRATLCLSSFELLQDDYHLPFPSNASDKNGEAQFDFDFPSMMDGEVGMNRREESVEKMMEKELNEIEFVIDGALREEEKLRIEKVEFATQTEKDTIRTQEVGWTVFERMKMDFRDVKIDPTENIDTLDFLAAAESLNTFFESFAPSAAALCGGPIIEDLRRIRARYDAHPASSRTLQQLVLSEQRTERRKLATAALQWTFRGLKFISMTLRYNLESNRTEELCTSFTRAWEVEYSKYFSFVVRPLFKLLIRACPSRDLLFDKMGHPRALVEQELFAYLQAVDRQVKELERFYSRDL